MDGDTPGQECPGEDHEMWPLADTKKPSSGTVPDDDSRLPCGGGGGFAPSVVAGGLLPVDVTDAPTLSVEGPQSVPSGISVVRVDGTIAEDTPGWECPREDPDWRPRAGVMRPAGVSVGSGSAGSLRGGTLPSLDVAGSLLPAVPAGGSPQGVQRTLLAQMARLLQVAPMAHVRRCLQFFTTIWIRSGSCWSCWPAYRCGPV